MIEPRVAFYGDSYTLGVGASSARQRWSTIICASRGWHEFNPSINGLGFVRNRRNFGDGDLPSQIIADRPDIVFVTLGLNDNFAFESDADRIRVQISTDLEFLRLALPIARVIVVEPFWYTDERPESLDAITGWIKTAAAFIGADYVAGASHWLEHHPEWMATDGLHPNDAGYARMGEQMDVALAALLLPARPKGAQSRGTQAESIN